ncbi:MAG: site-specific integrase [Clostridia bacterium]|nr:site-specific integrase [Clostridia bacterium]
MASISPRKDKAGNIISYQIRVSRGRDPLTGKQLTPYTTTYTPPTGWSNKAIERDLQKVTGEFEAACRRGEVLTKEEIRAKAQADQEAAEAARREAERKPTFNRYMARYLEELTIDHGAGTVYNYRKTLERAARVFGDMKLENIEYPALREYMTSLQTNGISARNTPFSIQTCKWHYATLHAFFQHALEADAISSNPMNRVKRPKQSKDVQAKQGTDKALNEAQVQEILKRAAEEPLNIYCLIVLALDSGMRRGELAGLKWSDIDFETGLVKISRNVQYTAELGTYLSTPKSGQGREIYLSHATLSVLTRWRREQAALFLKNGWKIDFTFTHDIGPEPINPNTITKRIRQFGKRIGYPSLHPHTFRHTSISLALLNGADVTSVSKRAGHSSVGITMDVYSHSTGDAQKRIASTLGDVIGKL